MVGKGRGSRPTDSDFLVSPGRAEAAGGGDGAQQQAQLQKAESHTSLLSSAVGGALRTTGV